MKRMDIALPDGLYIPPEALEVVLHSFTGPLDLLLYLIKKQNSDILDLPVLSIAEQYLQYLDQMKESHFDLAAEYLVMAATLIHLKSRYLLPNIEEPPDDCEDEDPCQALVRQLQEYAAIQQKALALNTLPQSDRDCLPVQALHHSSNMHTPIEPTTLMDLLLAYQSIRYRESLHVGYQVERENIPFAQTLAELKSAIISGEIKSFHDCLKKVSSKEGIANHFLAILSLVKLADIRLLQANDNGVICLSPVTHRADHNNEVTYA